MFDRQSQSITNPHNFSQIPSLSEPFLDFREIVHPLRGAKNRLNRSPGEHKTHYPFFQISQSLLNQLTACLSTRRTRRAI